MSGKRKIDRTLVFIIAAAGPIQTTRKLNFKSIALFSPCNCQKEAGKDDVTSHF